MSAAIVLLDGVSRSYDGGRVIALRNVSLSIPHGESVALVGPSGSGKSTLLHLVCGLDRPTQGRVWFQDAEPRTVRDWARLRAEKVGFVFQAFNLLPTLTALENVQLPMFGVLRGSRERRRRAEGLLERVGLSGRAGHRPCELSGGERQRVAIARSLANSPSLILADEPTGNLDSRTSESILDLLYELQQREGATLVMVTHDPGVAARAHRTIRMLDGEIVAAEARAAPAAPD